MTTFYINIYKKFVLSSFKITILAPDHLLLGESKLKWGKNYYLLLRCHILEILLVLCVQNLQNAAFGTTRRRGGSRRTTSSPTNIEAVLAFDRSPLWSAIHYAQALRMPDRTVWWILHEDKNFHLYKMAAVQEML